MEETFRFFIRKEYGDAALAMSNHDLDNLCAEFKKYLESKLSSHQFNIIVPKSPTEVICNMDNSLSHNGFHPAYYYHFTQFINENLAESSN